MASSITDLIMDAVEAGAPAKIARFLGKLYERTLAIDRNFKNMTITVITQEIAEIEDELKRVKLYKQSVPSTARERILACSQILKSAFDRLIKQPQR